MTLLSLHRVFLLFLLLPVLSPTILGQSNDQKIEVNRIDITIDGDMSKQEVLNQLTILETPMWLWIFLNENIYQKIGAPREYFDASLFKQDIIQLRSHLRDNGYFRSEVDTSFVFSSDQRSVNIGLSVRLNERTMIDTLLIHGLDDVPPEIVSSVLQRSPLKQGEPYSKRNVVEGQSSILRSMMNEGYPKIFLDTLSLIRYASTNNVSVMLMFDPGKRYQFGQIGFDHVDEDIDSTVLLRQIDFSVGDIYNEEKRLFSEQNLNRLGVFEFASLRQSNPGTAVSDSIPMLVSFKMLDQREITPEFLVLNENSTFFSIGLGLTYKHRNLFGGAQSFSISSSARANKIEDLYVAGAFRDGLAEPTLYGKADVQAQLAFPYFFSNKTSATITLTTEGEKQPEYSLRTLRARLGFSTRIETNTYGITEFNIEQVDPLYRKSSAAGIRPDDSTKQFNFIESFTLQHDLTNNFFSPTAGYYHSASIEEAGLVNVLAGGFNLPYSEYVKFSFLLKHYLSSEEDQQKVYAFKLKAGYAHLYNEKNQTPVPLPRRFFVGGSGSVRGWKDRQLSDFGDTLKGGNVMLEGSLEYRMQLFPNSGKILVMELPRFWSVTFIDFGNTWYSASDIRLKDVALAVGFGLRYETFVGPFRFDVAWRLYDPKRPPGSQWLTEQQFFSNSFSIIHFGIGHAF